MKCCFVAVQRRRRHSLLWLPLKLRRFLHVLLLPAPPRVFSLLGMPLWHRTRIGGCRCCPFRRRCCGLCSEISGVDFRPLRPLLLLSANYFPCLSIATCPSERCLMYSPVHPNQQSLLFFCFCCCYSPAVVVVAGALLLLLLLLKTHRWPWYCC